MNDYRWGDQIGDPTLFLITFSESGKTMVMRSTMYRNADIGRYSIVELMDRNGDFVQVDSIEESFSAQRLDTYEREY